MPIDTEDMLRQGEQFLREQYERRSSASTGEGEWSKLFTEHGEGGGPFGGRDNALTKLVGFFRAKSFPYDAALEMAHIWNDRYCDPPLLARDVHDKMGRAWASWSEGGHEDLTPDDLKTKKPEPEKKVMRFMTSDELLDLDASGGGMEWLVPNILVKGGLHFLTAPAAGSKTFIMIDLARCVASGTHWFGKFPVVRGAVLYIDEEMGERKMAARVRKLQVERGLPIHYLGKEGFVLSNDTHRQQVMEFCREQKVVLIILDTLTGVQPGLKENEAEHVSMLRRYFAELTTNDTAVVVAHHDRKGGKGDGAAEHERMAGSRDLAAMADMAYAIDRKTDYFHIGVSKNRLLADDEVLSLDFTLQDSEDRSTVSVIVVDAELRAEKVGNKLRMKIAEVLIRQGELTTAQLVEACEARKATVLEVAKAMVEAGELVTRKNGQTSYYKLSEETPF